MIIPAEHGFSRGYRGYSLINDKSPFNWYKYVGLYDGVKERLSISLFFHFKNTKCELLCSYLEFQCFEMKSFWIFLYVGMLNYNSEGAKSNKYFV